MKLEFISYSPEIFNPFEELKDFFSKLPPKIAKKVSVSDVSLLFHGSEIACYMPYIFLIPHLFAF